MKYFSVDPNAKHIQNVYSCFGNGTCGHTDGHGLLDMRSLLAKNV